ILHLAIIVDIPLLMCDRSSTRNLINNSITKNTENVVLNDFEQESTAQGAADEMIATLAKRNVDRVIVVNATDTLVKHLKDSHKRRSRAKSLFILLFQNRNEEVLYREA